MKRKLTRRNKQFLSSRYRCGYGGKGSFQRLKTYRVYFDESGNLVIGKTKVRWIWSLSTKHLEEILKIDQELGLYD